MYSLLVAINLILLSIILYLRLGISKRNARIRDLEDTIDALNESYGRKKR